MKSKGLGEKVKKSDQPGKVYHDQRKNAPEINKKCYLILKSGTLTKKAIDFALKSYSDLKKIINFLKTLTILISKSVAGVFKKRPRPKRPSIFILSHNTSLYISEIKNLTFALTSPKPP